MCRRCNGAGPTSTKTCTAKLPSCCTVSEIEDVSKSFQTESITKYRLTTINTRRETKQRVIAAKLTRLTHKIAIQLHLVTAVPFEFSL
jgi:hypothetical protein